MIEPIDLETLWGEPEDELPEAEDKDYFDYLDFDEMEPNNIDHLETVIDEKLRAIEEDI